jgi:thioredoxin 1
VEQLAQAYQGKLKVVKFNIENDTATPQKYGITSIPTLLVFKNGAVAKMVVGNSKAKLEEAVKQAIA